MDDQDWNLEDWLEREGGARLRRDTCDHQAIRSIYLWKTWANMRANGQMPTVPDELFSVRFSAALARLRDSKAESELASSVADLAGFPYVRVRVASAFAYWLRPNDYQLIDERSTQALGLSFADADYTPDNFVRWCALARDFSSQHALSLRQIDRALFAYHKLLMHDVFLG